MDDNCRLALKKNLLSEIRDGKRRCTCGEKKDMLIANLKKSESITADIIDIECVQFL